jgi:hypothetical protein
MSDLEVHRWRRSDTISLSTLIVLAGWIWYASAKASAWDETVQTVNQMNPKVETHGQQLSAIEATLSDMKEDVTYIRRHMKTNRDD